MDYNELIQDLNFCTGIKECGACKYYDTQYCIDGIMANAATAITELCKERDKLRAQISAPSFVANGEIMSVEPNIYDQEERHENCTVQILRNTITGAFSFGWWANKEAGNGK